MSIRAQIENDTRALALPTGRRVGQPGHDVARRYLIDRINQIGLAPFKGNSFELPYRQANPATGCDTEFINLIAKVSGTESIPAPLLIGAHYDSVIDGPCADDNATAVAVVLAAAERFVRSPLRRDLIVALFDAEEPPFFLSESMGSIRFHEDHCAGIAFSCALILDLIGHDVEFGSAELSQLIPHVREMLFVMGAESDHSLPAVVEQSAMRANGLRILPTLNSYIGDMSDHHAFRVAGQPFLFLSCGQGKYYHHPRDDMGWINLDKVAQVAEFSIDLLQILDRVDPHAPRPCDPVDFELRMMEKAIGPGLPWLRELLGLQSLATRADLGRFVRAVATTLLG